MGLALLYSQRLADNLTSLLQPVMLVTGKGNEAQSVVLMQRCGEAGRSLTT
jgi:hypothetical protein